MASVDIYALYYHHNVIWEACENYQKRSIRNRCNVVGPKDKMMLTVPLKSGKNEQLNIHNVAISYDENWIHHFKETIKTFYSPAPYFEHYWPDILSIVDKRISSLWELNIELHLRFLKWLQLTEKQELTTEWKREYENAIDLRKNSNIIEVNYTYFQVPNGTNSFVKGLSILDLMFCMGPESSLILKNSVIQIS